MSSLYPQRFGCKLQGLREAFYLTHAEMAKGLEWYGVKKGFLDAEAISQFESGERELPLVVLIAYAKYAGVTVTILLDDEVNCFPLRTS